MDTVIISCRTLETELEKAREETGALWPVIYLESGLHNTPPKLKDRLQKELDTVSAPRVLLAMGYCGNAVAGLRTGDFELIIPRADDCIALLLGSQKRRNETGRALAAYFLTEGWLRGERNIWTEYTYMVDKYGEKKARSLSKMLFGSYRTLALLDAGVEPVEPLVEKSRIIADTLGLKQQVVPGTLEFLKGLLTGPWEKERFLRIGPGETVTLHDLLEYA